MDSTGRPDEGLEDGAFVARRALLGLLGLASGASLLPPGDASARDYASRAEVFDEIDRLEAEVGGRLEALKAAAPGARVFVESLGADHARHRAERARLRERLGMKAVAPAPAAAPPDRAAMLSDPGLDPLRTVQEALVYAHAEGLPALDDAEAVATLALHMVDLSRHLTVIDLWIEAEGRRG